MPYNLLTSLIPYVSHILLYIRQVLTVLFFSCTTCIVYQYFKEHLTFVLKAGAKVKALFLTTKLFRKFFLFFLFTHFSGSLCERERMYKRSLQPIGQSSFTLLGWFRLSSIDQYSSLLPPVGVWTVSQFQCGGPSSQNPYPSLTWWAVTPPTI